MEGMGLVPLHDFYGKEIVDEKKLVNIGTLPQVKADLWLIASIRKIPNPLAIVTSWKTFPFPSKSWEVFN